MSVTTQFSIARDVNGIPIYSMIQTNTIYNGLLSAGIAKTITAPTDMPRYGVNFGISNGCDLLFAINATAVIPTNSTPALGNTSVNKAQVVVNAGDTISIISPQSNVLYGIEFYAL